MNSESKGSFNCNCCGECCSGDMRIFINIYDLYKIAKHLDFTNTKELFNKKYVVLTQGQNSLNLPMINFKTSPYKFCPFLENHLTEENELKGFCSLHPYIKPLVCILAPISKEIDLDCNKTNYYITMPTDYCSGTICYENKYIENTKLEHSKEISYENRYYNILNTIINKKIINYESIFHFDTEKSFEDIINDIENFLL